MDNNSFCFIPVIHLCTDMILFKRLHIVYGSTWSLNALSKPCRYSESFRLFVYLKCNISKTINKYSVCPTVPHLLVIFRILVSLVRRGRDKFPNQNIMISYTHSKKFIHKRAIRIFLHILTFQITILYSVYTQNFQSSWKSFLLGCNGHGLV